MAALSSQGFSMIENGWTKKVEGLGHKYTEARELLLRAADTLQDMESETNSDMNNSLAMEIWAFLEE